MTIIKTIFQLAIVTVRISYNKVRTRHVDIFQLNKYVVQCNK